jgi:flagellar basal body rod protein FlgC
MLGEISSRDFAEWMAYARLEPFGEERDDLRMGIIASTIANVNRDKGKKPYSPRDFMPSFEQEDDETKIQKMMESLRLSLGGKR